MIENIRDERQMRAMTGLSQEKFAQLLPTFSRVYAQARYQAYEQGLAAGSRTRKPGGGQKGKLPQMADKLYFILSYYKTYPTFDELGARFDLARSKAHAYVYQLSPILHQTLRELGSLPEREFESVEAFRAKLQDWDQILIDVTERPHHRPQDEEQQRELYSGKKKRHTVKNLTISTLSKVVLFVGQTVGGRNHDYAMLKREFPPEFPWLEWLIVLVDLGFQGILSDYEGENIFLPFKKPRKSKDNPAPKLTEAQKAVNQALAKIRVLAKNAIAGIKRFTILTHIFRNRKDGFADQVIAVAAGLWNFWLA
jgi:hypothetical protein